MKFCPSCMLQGALHLGASDNRERTARLGDYQLLEEIARGGMGVVYRARQTRLNRIVAVKLILIGQFADKATVRRFQAEATAAAKLQHPNIVAIHGIGDEAGQHYFSMEYIDGPNLADFMRDQPITVRQAARLVQKIAEAVHFAHQQGIVHRDLKPSNILIDGLLEPRITDFGLARDLTIDSELTLSGQVLGSPNYISPEQACGRSAGPASDIYSLGAILYHLLTGRPPFAAETLTATLQQVNTAEPVSPRILNPSVPRDLETICRKCLEKEPDKRYRNAELLAEDLRRLQEGLPITAKAISPSERAWRWCRRKPALASALTPTLVVAIGSPVAAIRIDRERQRAEAAQKRAEANEKKAQTEATKSRYVADFMRETLEGVEPSVAKGRDTTMLREILETTAQRLGEGLQHEPAVQGELRHTIGGVYRAIGEYNKAEQMLRESVAIRRKIHGAESLELAESLDSLAWALRNLGEHAQATAQLREALVIRRKVLGDEHSTVARVLYHAAIASRVQPDIEEFETLHRNALAIRRKCFGEEHPDIALLLHGLGILLERRGKFHDAELAYRESLAMRRKLLGKDHPDAADSLASLAALATTQQRFLEAEGLYRELLAICSRVTGMEHTGGVNTLLHLGAVLVHQGKIDEAERLYRQALAILKKHHGDDHPEVADVLERLSGLLKRQDRLFETESASRAAVAARRKILQKDSRSTRPPTALAGSEGDDEEGSEFEFRTEVKARTKLPANEWALSASLRKLAIVLRSQGKWQMAKDTFLDAAQFGDPAAIDSAAWFVATCPMGEMRDANTAVALAETAVAASERRSAAFLDTLAAAYAISGRFAAAIGVQQEAIALVENEKTKKEYEGRLRLFQSKEPCVEYWRMGAWLHAQGRLTDAESFYHQELAMRRTMFGKDDIDVTTAMNDLAGVLRDQGRLAEAETLARECLAIREKEMPADWRTFQTRSLLGSVLLNQRRYADAEPLLLSGYEGLKPLKEKFRPEQKRSLVEAVRNLVELNASTGKTEKADQWKEKLAEFDSASRQERFPSNVGK